MKKKLDTMGTGTGKGLSSSREPITDARNIARLADAGAKRFARIFEAEAGHTLQPCEVEEAAAIYRAELARVYALGAHIPETDSRGYAPDLWACSVHRHAGRKATRIYRQWRFALCRLAMRRAGKRARSMCYGHGAERCEFIPLPVEHGEREIGPQLAAAFQAGESGVRSAWAMVSGASGRGVSARNLVAMRRAYWDDRLRLAIYWARRGGQRWTHALEAGLRLLGAVHQSMTGRGCSGLLALGFGIGADTARRDRDRFTKAVSALRAEVNGGEAEISAHPGSVGNTLSFLELVSDTPIFARGGEGRKALANREAIARLRARLIALANGATIAPAMPDHTEAIAARVERHRDCQRRAGVGLWADGPRGVPVFLPSGGISRPNLSAYASRLVARNAREDAGQG